MPYLILDRDGVINEESDDFIKTPEEWLPIPGSLDAIASLTRAGYRIGVITNQSGVARGLLTEATLARIHDKMLKAVETAGGHIEAVLYCPHGPEHFCDCRKPRPGLFHAFASRFDIDLAGVPVIGDSYRDLEAARAVGAFPILVETGKGRRTLARYSQLDVPVYSNLYEAAQHLLLRHA